MRRPFRIAARLSAAVAIAVGLLAGCRSSSPAVSPDPAQTGPLVADGPLSPMKNLVELTCVAGYTAPEDSTTPAGTSPENQSFNKLLEERLNIRLKYLWSVPIDQYDQKFNLTISSGEIPDIMKISANDFANFDEAGSLEDMRQAYDAYALPSIKQEFQSMNNEPLDMCSNGGKLFAIPYCWDTFQQVELLYIRQDWLDKLHLQPPRTIDDVLNIAVAFATQDPDGNHIADTTGLGLYKTIRVSSLDASGLFQGYGAYPDAWLLKDGVLVPGTIQPEVRQALIKLREFYQKGGINKEFAVKTIDQLIQDTIDGKVGMLYGEWWLPNWPLNSNLKKDPQADWRAFTIVTPDGSPAKTIVDHKNIANYNVVSVKAPKGATVAAMKLMNLWWDIQYNSNSKDIYGAEATPAGGYVYNWAPIYPYMTNEQMMNFQKVNEALDANNSGTLTTKMQNDLYTASRSWLKNGLKDEDGWKNWGMWFSRVAKDGGWGLTVKVKDAGQYIYNEYYGNPTPTEIEKSAALYSMEMEYFNDFIMGNVDDASWNKFVSDWNALGGDMWTKEVNKQYMDIKTMP